MSGTIAIWIALALQQVGGQAAEAHSATLEHEIEALARPLVARADFSGTIALQGPGTHVRLAVGWADWGLEAPNRPDTRFGIGSVAKGFTAALILRLVEAGTLRLSDTLSSLLPELSDPPVTVHQLLAHRSGLARDPYQPEHHERQLSSDDILEIIAGLPREFEPDARSGYSNSGYIVLAILVERVVGRPYCDVLRDSVFVPLGLTDTGCLDNSRTIPGLAHGYDPGPGPTRLRPTPYRAWANSRGAGGLYSTAEDLVRWGQVILNRAFLSPESWAAMLTDHGDGRGYGLARYRRHGHMAIGHDGVTNGYTAFVEVYPDDGTVVAYAGNIRSGAFEIMEGTVTALALGLDVTPGPTPADLDLAVRKSVARRVVGRYRLFPGFFLTISYDDERLLLAGTGGYPTVLSSGPDGSFFYRAMYATIRFEGDGEDAELVWIDRNGREYRAARAGQ